MNEYIDNFKKEYGIQLILDEDVQNYLENYAHDNNIPVSFVLKRSLSGASALNYMGIKEPFNITKDMVQDERYFDKLFSRWYENQKENNLVKHWKRMKFLAIRVGIFCRWTISSSVDVLAAAKACLKNQGIQSK